MEMTVLFYASLLCLIFCGPIQEVSTEEVKAIPEIDNKLKCDSCLAIGYQLKLILDKASQKTPGIKLSELDAIDAVSPICKHHFDEYEAINDNGQHHLMGPGLSKRKGEASEIPRDKWMSNLKEMCQKYMGEVGELRIYDSYYKDPTGVKDYLCNGAGVRGICIQSAREDMMYPGAFMYDDFFMSDEL